MQTYPFQTIVFADEITLANFSFDLGPTSSPCLKHCVKRCLEIA